MDARTADARPCASFPAGGGERIAVTSPSAEAALSAVMRRLEAGTGFTLFTLNLDHLVKLRRDTTFRAAYRAADLIVADGRPVIWLAWMSAVRIGLAPGSDLVHPLVALAARLSAPVALYGASQETLKIAAQRLEAANPGLRVTFMRAPSRGFDPLGPEAEADIAALGASGARLCLLALGAPKQEIFAVRAAAAAPACGFAAIGAGLDFVAGTQTRAPRWIRRLALEWLWRLAISPRRFAPRYAACIALLPDLARDALRLRRMGAHSGERARP